jgi:putative ABC transport system permease protein
MIWFLLFDKEGAPTIINSKYYKELLPYAIVGTTRRHQMGTLTRATRNLTRRKTRTLIVIVALSLALILLITLPSSITASQGITQRTINILTAHADQVASTINLAATQIDCSLGTNFTITPMSDNSTVMVQLITGNITDYAELNSIPDVDAVIPVLQQLGILKYGVLNGVPLDSASLLNHYPSILPANITEGRNLQAGDSNVVVVQERLAKVYGVTVGSTLTLSGRDFQVVGIEGQEALNSTAITMSLTDAQAITNKIGQASGFTIYVDNIDNVNTVLSRIKNSYPDLQVTDGLSQVNSAQEIQTSIETQVKAANNNLNQVQNTGIVEIGIATIAVTAIILFLMLYSVRERTREIGTLKAMGSSNKAILGQFILEGILLSLIAAIVAILISVFTASTIANALLPHTIETATFGSEQISIGSNPSGYTGVSVAITPEIMLFGLSIAILLGTLGSLYPALKAARTKPAEAMRYE